MIGRLPNAAWAILEYLWYPLLLFASTPYFLRVLGTEQYGLWMLLTATVGVGVVLNTGTGAATIRLVSEALGRGDRDRVGVIVRGGLAVALIGGTCLGLFMLMLFAVMGDLLFERMGDLRLVRLVGVFAAPLVLLEQLDNVLAAAIRGAERFERLALLEVATRTSQMIGALGAVSIGGGIETVFTVLIVVAVGRLIAKASLVRRTFDMNNFLPLWTKAGDLLHLSKWGWIQGLGAMLFNSADRFMVGALLGATALSHYSVILMLPQQIHAIAAAGASVVFPRVSRTTRSHQSLALANVMRIPLLSVAAFSMLAAASLWVFGDLIFGFWLSAPLPPNVMIAYRLLVLAYFLLALNTVPHFTLLGLGKLRFIALLNVVAGAIATVMMLLVTNDYGIVGVGACRVLYAFMTSACIVPLIMMKWRQGHAERSQSGGNA